MENAKDRPHDGSRSQNPTPQYHTPVAASISWDDLRKIEMAFMPLLILSGGDEEERDPEPPQALVRLHLRMVWRELSALARRAGGGQ
jgi:hypothetical protein